MVSTHSELIHAANELHERMVLSEMLGSRRMVLDLEPEYFSGRRRALYEALQSQWDTQGEITPELLPAALLEESERVLETIGCVSGNVRESLRREYLRRSIGLLIEQCLRIEDPTEALEALQGYAAEALHSHKSTSYNHRESMTALLAALERGVNARVTVVGWPTGIEVYDRLTNGFDAGKLYVVGALKKTGKSRWMAYAAIKAAEAGAGVLINSLEMSPMRLNQLALAYYSKVNAAKLGRYMARDEYIRVSEGFASLSKLNWRIYRDHTIASLRSRILYERTRGPVDVVFIDFIQRMRDPTYKSDRVREVERISQDLADLARSLGVAVVALAQLKGEAENLDKGRRNTAHEDTMPDMRHLKESQGISENADVITILHNPDRHKDPYTEDGGYRVPTVLCKVEQRDDISGTVIKLQADLRICEWSVAPD